MPFLSVSDLDGAEVEAKVVSQQHHLSMEPLTLEIADCTTGAISMRR